MADIEIRVPFMEFTPVYNSFIDEYLKEANGDFVKVYLLCLRLGHLREASSVEKIATALNLLQADVAKAFDYWVNLGIMKYTPDGFIQLLPLKENKIEDLEVYYDGSVKEMFRDIERLTGRPLSSKELSVYMSMIDDFSFSPEVITFLVEYCSSKKKTDFRYIEKVGLAWYDNGIKSIDDAQNYITKHEEKWNSYRAILSFMGIKDNDISKPQEEFLEKWLFKFNFPVDVIQEAIRICTMRINESNFSYIDKILADWSKNGVKNINDIKKASKKPKGTKKAASNSFGNYSGQRQYDMQELRKQLLGRGDSDEK
jgi:DnaD/phage-associated family protein